MSSSNEWETVTKTRKQKNFEKKVEAHTEKKKLEAAGPKLEEILPSHQYRNLISGKAATTAAGGKENLSPAKSTSSSTKSKSPKKQIKANQNVKKPTQSQQQQQQQQQVRVAMKPKSLEIALRQITTDDFISHLEQLKLTYPGSELLWLKGIASYLNTNLPFDCDPTFSGKSINYPSNLATQSLKNTVTEFLASVGEENLSYFYHTLLQSMVMELTKNLPIVGYKFLLQLIGQNWPQICSKDMAKTAILRNSYLNRSNICLSILWAIGQGGYQRLMDGIKVWQNLMLPNLELKSYSKFITDYIERILSAAVDQSLNLNQNEFFAIYYALQTNTSGIARELQDSLLRSSEIFLQKYIASSAKHANIFLTLLRQIESVCSSSKHDNIFPTLLQQFESVSKNRIVLEGCLSCLIRGADSFKVWKMNYKKQLVPTILLLQKIVSEWNDRAAALTTSNDLIDFLAEAQKLNAELELAKRRDPNLDDLIEIVAHVQEKSAQQKKKQNAEQKKKCGCCKWVFGSLVLLALIAGALNYDTHVNGKGVFAKSATGKALNNAGLLPHVEKGWYTTMSTSARGYKWAEKNVPPYAKPAGKLACDMYKLFRNAACNAFENVRDIVKAKLPVAAKFLEQYVPGLPKKIENFSVAVGNAAIDVYGNTVRFVKTNVLVGRLSPESLSKALNETQNAAWEYYYTFHKKVDAYAKLK